MPITNWDGVVPIEYEWNLGSGTVEQEGNIILNNSNATTQIELIDKAKLDTYGLHFNCISLDQTKENGIEIRFYPESLSIEDSIELYFPINDTGVIIDDEVKIPVKAYKVEIQIYGTWTCGYNYIYGKNTGGAVATTTSTGIVSVPVKSGISVAVDGKITLNCGDGVHVTQEGKLSTKSDVSGSNWYALDLYESADDIIGFIVNGTLSDANISGGYHFEFLSNGNLLYKNANREIRIGYHNGAMPEWVGEVEENDQ